MAIKAGAVKRSASVKLPSAKKASLQQKVSTLREQLKDALQAAGHLDKPSAQNPYPMGSIEDMYGDTVVFYKEWDDFYACNYTITNEGEVTLTDKIAVEKRTLWVEAGT